MAPPLEVTLTGQSKRKLPAEFAVLYITVSSEDTQQEATYADVQATSKLLREALLGLEHDGNSDSTTAATITTAITKKDSPLTDARMTSLTSRSWQPYDRESNGSVVLPRRFATRATFNVGFRDFGMLSQIASRLFQTPHITIDSTAWRLTEKTLARIGSECRKDAMRDAIAKAHDYADVVGRGVHPIRVVESGASIFDQVPRSRSAVVPAGARNHGGLFGTLSSSDPQAVVETLSLEPELVTVSTSVSVVFASDD